MDEYRTAFEQLNIEQGVFDQIIADEGARGEICECLMLCLTSVPSLREVASALLQYIAASVAHGDGGPGSGNHGHAGVPGQVGGSAPGPSDEEIKSIRLFTGSPDVIKSEDAKRIESAIKKTGPLDSEYEYSRGMGMSASDIDKLLKDGYYEPGRLTSWSPDESTAADFAYDRAELSDKIPVILQYRGTKQLDKGIEVGKWSQHPEEDEAIFSGSIKMKVAINEVSGYSDGEATGTVYINLYDPDDVNTDGGPGSGNFGHAGVPGQVGGSAPGNGMTAEESAKVTSGLNDSLKKAVSSAKTREEKYYAAKKVISEAPVGSCVKVGFFEARKVVDGASPDEPAYSTGYDDTPSKSLSDLMHLVDYSGWGFEPEFVDGVAKKAQAREAVAQMREAGKISGSDEVRKGEEGLISSGSSKYGQPGSYAIYRTGEVSENGMVFFATTKEGADTYASQHDNKTSQYRAVLKNPLVVEGAGDGECLAKAHEILTGKKISGGLTDTKWIAADRQNASALASSGYDSIIYVVNGRPTEVQIPGATARSMTENIGTYSTTEWSRLGKTIEGAVFDDSFKQQPTDYKRLDGKNLDSSEKPLDFKAQSATIKSKEDTAFDGAPKGNQNAAGPHKGGGGSGHKLSQTERTKLENRFVGKKSSKGTEIKKFSEHAFERLGGRAISAGRFEKMLNSTDTKPDKNHPDRTLYDVPGSRMVLSDDGTVVSIMWRRQN